MDVGRLWTPDQSYSARKKLLERNPRPRLWTNSLILRKPAAYIGTYATGVAYETISQSKNTRGPRSIKCRQLTTFGTGPTVIQLHPSPAMSTTKFVNEPAADIPYFTPAQIPASGTAVDPQPDGKPIPKVFKPLKVRGVEFQNRIFVRMPSSQLGINL